MFMPLWLTYYNYILTYVSVPERRYCANSEEKGSQPGFRLSLFWKIECAYRFCFVYLLCFEWKIDNKFITFWKSGLVWQITPEGETSMDNILVTLLSQRTEFILNSMFEMKKVHWTQDTTQVAVDPSNQGCRYHMALNKILAHNYYR